MKNLVAYGLLIFTLLFSCNDDDQKPDAPASNRKGQVNFWLYNTLECGDVSVTINGETGIISSSYTEAPACGSPGIATFSLPEGTYNYTASCADQAWSGSVNVLANGCTKLQLSSKGTGTEASTGSVIFYTDEDRGCGHIKVTINDISKVISLYYPEAVPECGVSGNATFRFLEYGVYTWSAECPGGLSWGPSTVTIKSDKCIKIKI